MRKHTDHLIPQNSKIRDALVRLNELNLDNILFVVDELDRLIGALTDGDIRRGLINGIGIDSTIDKVTQTKPKFIYKDQNSLDVLIGFREGNFKIIPVLDKNRVVVNVINFRYVKSYLPIDAVIMAGGRGQRLQPLTNFTPKPLLKVGNKPIIEHNLDRLIMYGIDDFWISVNYLGNQIKNYFGTGHLKNVKIEFVDEIEPLGTIGAVSKINNFKHNYILITNSDLLTNINYEDFFIEFIKQDADFAVLSIPYQITVPYAVLETKMGEIKNFKEKPTYTYYANGGVYLLKRTLLDFIPKNKFYNATDLMKEVIENGFKIISYPFSGYWLDVGKHEDFEKAQNDIKNISFL